MTPLTQQFQVSPHLRWSSCDSGIEVKLQNLDDLIETLQWASANQIPVQPDFGQIRQYNPGLWLNTDLMNAVQKMNEPEGLVTVQTGITAGQLRQFLNQYGYELPLTYAPKRSILSLLSQETISLNITKHGLLRRYVLATEAFTGDAQYMHYGAEVVKNVTGYDMNKLWIGSHNAFGILTAVTLKLQRQPKISKVALLHMDSLEQVMDCFNHLLYCCHALDMVTMYRYKATFGWQILVRSAGHPQLVDHDWEAVHQFAQHLDPSLQVLNAPSAFLDEQLEKLDWQDFQQSHHVVVQVMLSQHAMNQFLLDDQAATWFESADILHPALSHTAFLRWRSPLFPYVEELENLRDRVTTLGGNVNLVAWPVNYPAPKPFSMDIHASAQHYSYYKELKHVFDPHQILMPTRPSPSKINQTNPSLTQEPEM